MRHARARTGIVALLSTALAALPAAAQQPGPITSGPVPPGPVTSAPIGTGTFTSANVADVFSIEQLDALLAPIALYPDAVLAPLLLASSDPLQVVMAARWTVQPAHASLSGDALATALADEDWDPEVKALAPFPSVLRMLNDNLDWTMQLGYAVLNQPAAVLDSIQRLRRQALATGTLANSAQITVQRAGAAVTIAPASATAMSVPAYDPAAAYGQWPYATVAPVRVSASDTAAAEVPAILRDLCGFAWGSSEIVLNVKSWNAANAGRPPITVSVWHPRPTPAVSGSVDASLGARPLPPPGPVGRPAPPSGIPANAIGRPVVTVSAELVRRPPARVVGSSARPALPAATMRQGPIAAAQPVAMHLAPLPAHVETVRATALADVNAGAQAVLFGTRGAESRNPLGIADPPRHQDMAGLAP